MNRITALVLILLLAAGGAYLWWRSTHVPKIAVLLHTVGTGKVESVVANTRAGTVEAARRSKLAPQTGGQVSTLEVKKGDRVAQGQVLLTLWNDDLRAQIALAESEEIRSQALAEQIRLMAEIAESDSKRMQELKQQEISSGERTDHMIAEAHAKRAELAAAQAAVRVAHDRIATARAALERTILRAPFAGVVAEINAELGEYVTPSPPGIPTLPAIDLIDTDNLRVKAPLDEVDAAAVVAGQEVRITLDAQKGKRFAGRVTRKAPYVLDREKEARTVDIEVQFADAEDSKLVAPGASADVEVVLKTASSCLRVPTQAILDGKKVLVFESEDLPLQERAIVPGIGNWEFTEVLEGLKAGEVIVLSLDRLGVKAGALTVSEQKRDQASR